jgi:hypothetical protein
MRRHQLAGAAAVLVIGGIAMLGRAADDKKPDPHRGHAEIEACLRECAQCTAECESCFAHCTHLVAEGKKEHLRTLSTCIDCGDLCSLAGKIMARHGAFTKLTCEACAKACDACGKECDKFPSDEHMSRCSKSCKDCAKACRDMLKAIGA